MRPLTEQVPFRAEALLRIARIDLKLNRPEAAIAIYERLSHETGSISSGVPYALLAAGAQW